MEELTSDLRILQFNKYYLDDKKKDRMGRACSTQAEEERRGAYRVWWGNLNERNHLKELGIDG